jgi:hypothetical protein
MNKPKWTQDDAIAFECARECITDLMGICSTAIADEERQLAPDVVHLAKLEKNLVELACERSTLTVANHDRIETIRRDYGAVVRAHRESFQPQEPGFLDDEGPSADIPSFISTTNARELFELRPGETVAQAAQRVVIEKKD